MDEYKYIDMDAVEKYGCGELEDAYKFFGCHYVPQLEMHRFAVWAPAAKAVSVLGDFNDWNPEANAMQRVGSGAWVGFVRGAEKGHIYKYAITSERDNTVLKADPFAFHCETGPATGSKVWDIDGFTWHDSDYREKMRQLDVLNSPMSIYELHVGSWKKKENEKYPWYRTVARELAEYCNDMGYTHVELLPVMEYPYEGSWGYQVTGYFAPTSRYGTPEDFMYFIDTLHGAGISVIIDWVPAHFPRDAHGLALFDGTALFERSDPDMAAHPDWGTLIFDYSKGSVQSFLLSSAALFLDVYHVDGLRVDAVSSMVYLGYSRGGNYHKNQYGGDTDLGAIELLRRINAMAAAKGAITVAEESSAYPGVTAPASEGGLGFTFKWDMGYMHDTLDYFELDPLFRKGSHGKLTFSMMYAFTEHFILAYSHDEVVHGKKSMLNKMFGEYDDKFATLRTLYAYQYGHPGKKLNFMGSEFGQFIEWDYKKELDWFLLDYPRHAEMQRYVRELNKLYTSHKAMYAADTGWHGFKWLNVDDADRSSIAFMRMGGGESIVCVCNFTPVNWKLQIGLPTAGRLDMLLNSDEYRFGGKGTALDKTVESTEKPFLEFKYSAMIDLPPLSALYYKFTEENYGSGT